MLNEIIEKHPTYSIIILNWNGEALIEECLQFVFQSNYKDIEVIVVDNASTDSSIQIVKKFEHVHLIQNEKNLGYAAGNNVGFKAATGEFIVSLNNDISVDPAWLDKPVEFFRADPLIGIVSCRQMQYFQREKIDGLYHIVMSDLSVHPFGLNKKYDASDKRHSKPGFIISANGGSAIYRKSLIDQLGGLDERFFAYIEEADLCFRAFYNGWKCIYSPTSIVYHRGSVSFSKNQSKAYYYRERNRVLFLYKNIPLLLIISRLFPIFIWELRVIRVFFKVGQPLLYVKARIDAFKELHNYAEIRAENLALLKPRKMVLKELLKKQIEHIDPV